MKIHINISIDGVSKLGNQNKSHSEWIDMENISIDVVPGLVLSVFCEMMKTVGLEVKSSSS